MSGFGSALELRRAWEVSTEPFPRFMADLDRRRVPYLSHSKVATVERCAWCYFQQYVLGRQPSSDALTTGELFHRAAAALYEGRRAGRPSGSPSARCEASPRHPSPDLQSLLDNAVTTLGRNIWESHEVVGVETLFFMDLAPELAPVIGVIDLILRDAMSFVVVDHKTSKRFGEPDRDQLVLYAEHVRRANPGFTCAAAFDEYRLVPSLQRARTPVFRRTLFEVTDPLVERLILRYRRAWQVIERLRNASDAVPSPDCWFCWSDRHG